MYNDLLWFGGSQVSHVNRMGPASASLRAFAAEELPPSIPCNVSNFTLSVAVQSDQRDICTVWRCEKPLGKYRWIKIFRLPSIHGDCNKALNPEVFHQSIDCFFHLGPICVKTWAFVLVVGVLVILFLAGGSKRTMPVLGVV